MNHQPFCSEKTAKGTCEWERVIMFGRYDYRVRDTGRRDSRGTPIAEPIDMAGGTFKTLRDLDLCETHAMARESGIAYFKRENRPCSPPHAVEMAELAAAADKRSGKAKGKT